mgnify:CR=1 FL=1
MEIIVNDTKTDLGKKAAQKGADFIRHAIKKNGKALILSGIKPPPFIPFEEIRNTYTSMGITMNGMSETFSSAGQDVSKIVPTLDSTMLEVQNLMVDLKETLDEFSKSPSDILYKEELIKKAPGEK